MNITILKAVKMGGCSVKFNGISKIFPGVIALDNVSFYAKPGEVLGLMGENGAGKSTILKVLNGDYMPSKGCIELDDLKVSFSSPIDALKNGISVIYQDMHVAPYLSVAENLFLGNLPQKNGLVNWKVLFADAQKIIKEYDLCCSPYEKIINLSVAKRQMIEITKDVIRDVKIIAFDEPTASLSEHEIETLFGMIRKLKDNNVTVIYVSHRMNEIFEISDRVVILKDGKYVDAHKTKETSPAELIKCMVGREIKDIFPYKPIEDSKKEILQVKNLTSKKLREVSFTLYSSEILGFAGLVGSGRSELAHAIFGADKLISGEIFVNGKKVIINSPKNAIKYGIALCPEDRKTQSLFGIQSVKNNLVQVMVGQLSKYGLLNNKKEIELTSKYVKNLQIRTSSINKKIQELSGGNQQKTILGRWLSTKPSIMILDEPTKGVDVGSKAEIYNIINKLKEEGVSIIIISSELPEIIGVSDRIMVMKDGRISGEISRLEATEEKILTLAMDGGNNTNGSCK